MKQVKKLLGTLLVAVSLSSSIARAQPDPNTILDQIRSAQVEIGRTLKAKLRPEKGESIPIKLQFSGQQIQYEFTNPAEKLTVQLTDTGSTLSQQTTGGPQTLSGSKLTETVRGTDVTYEDLSLRFLYWRNAHYEGERNVRSVTCSVILVQPPSRNSEYGSVRVWIAKDRGAMVKAEGFDSAGRLIKRFEVISIQTIEDKTIFKQIRIERVDPSTGKIISRTYLELESP
jgi:Outer membrane lipoprotein-sorting protein